VINSKDSYFKKLVTSIEERIYREYKIDNPTEFMKDCEDLSTVNPLIDSLCKEISSRLKRSLTGTTFELPLSVIDKFPIDIVTKANSELAKIELGLMYQSFSTSKNNHKFESSKFLSKVNMAEERMKILRENGFDYSEDYHAEEILSNALIFYTKKDIYMKLKMQTIETLKNHSREEMESGSFTEDQLEQIKIEISQISE